MAGLVLHGKKLVTVDNLGHECKVFVRDELGRGSKLVVEILCEVVYVGLAEDLTG